MQWQWSQPDAACFRFGALGLVGGSCCRGSEDGEEDEGGGGPQGQAGPRGEEASSEEGATSVQRAPTQVQAGADGESGPATSVPERSGCHGSSGVLLRCWEGPPSHCEGLRAS